MKRNNLLKSVFALATIAISIVVNSQTITRDKVIQNANTFVFDWTPTADNLCPSGCSCSGKKIKTSARFKANTVVTGMAYEHGGFSTVQSFKDGLKNKLKAGDLNRNSGTTCAVGVDCVGFVTRCFEYTSWVGMSTLVNDLNPKYGKDYSKLQKGDVLYFYVLNDPLSHIMIVVSNDKTNKKLKIINAGGKNNDVVGTSDYTYSELEQYASGKSYQGGVHKKVSGLKSAPVENDIIDDNSHEEVIEPTSTESAFYVSPNPAKSQITVNISSLSNGDIISVYNNMGILVKSVKIKSVQKTSIDIKELPAGLYYISTVKEDRKYLAKFIKE